MIVIQCTNCKRQLSIDDAFAGGVCRCQHCGTIQTVPAAGSTAPAHSIDAPGAARSLYAQAGRGGAGAGGTPGTGLDDLAGYVASSGLSSGRLTKTERPAKPRNLLPLWIRLGVVVGIALIAVIYFVTRPPVAANPAGGPGGGNGTGTPVAGQPGTQSPAVPVGPNFNGIPLDGRRIVYCIDRGAATQSRFGEVEDAVYKSLQTLGPDRKFMVCFWTDKTEDNWDFPQGSTAYATKENVDAAKSAWSNSFALGGNDGKAAIETALAQNPDLIVLVSGKADTFPGGWLTDVMALRGPHGTRFLTIGAQEGGGTPSTTLKDLAAKTGGTYADLQSNP